MWQVVGHEWAVDVLSASLAAGRASHAYLFAGPPSVGKLTLALNLAQAVNCLQQDTPCQQCESCHRIKNGTHPDVHLVDLHYQALLRDESDSDQKELRIDTIRSISQQAGLKPFQGRHKVFIISDAETMNIQAANSLLKTLEEPPAHVMLILTTTDSRLLPPTIVSRCQILGLRLVPTEVIESELRDRHGLGAAQASAVARMSGGRIGWAIDMARDMSALDRRGESMRQLAGLSKMARLDQLDFAQELARDRSRTRDVLDLWLAWWRDLLLVKGGHPQMIGNVDLAQMLEQDARTYELRDIAAFIGSILSTLRQLEKNVDPRLALEVLMLNLPPRGS
jgi:DNA polymerase-3 subunit delta'